MGLLAEEAGEHGIAAAVNGGLRLGLDRARGEDSFQAAAIAAGADRAIGIDGDVAHVAGDAGVAAEQAAVDDRGAADAGAERQHEDVIVTARGAPDHLAGERDARIVIGENGDFEGQADEIHDAQSLEEMHGAGKGFDARAVGIDDALAADADSGGERGGFQQPADGIVERGQKRIEVARRGQGARGEDGAIGIHHAGANLVAADIDSENHQTKPPGNLRRR